MANTCEIWGTPAQHIPPSGDYIECQSRRAGGKYRVANSLLNSFAWQKKNARNKAKITTWILEEHLAGITSPLISNAIFDRICQQKPLSITTRKDRTLQYLANKSTTINQSHQFSGIMDDEIRKNVDGLCIASESVDSSEAHGFLRFLTDAKLLTKQGDIYTLTYEGWSAAEELNHSLADNEQAFVAMWFDKTMLEAYEVGIEPAIRERGYRSIRIDKIEHVNKIDDEIIAEIRRSKFLVADFTSSPNCPRGGVYFEAGFAFGLNKPVIWTCRSDLIAEVHFDTRQYNHIVWSSPDQLRAALSSRIGAVIGDGPLLRGK